MKVLTMNESLFLSSAPFVTLYALKGVIYITFLGHIDGIAPNRVLIAVAFLLKLGREILYSGQRSREDCNGMTCFGEKLCAAVA
jgi:hypothetical protein